LHFELKKEIVREKQKGTKIKNEKSASIIIDMCMFE